MSQLSWNIRNWLLQIPKPVKVRITDDNGDTKDLDVGKRPMVRVAESVAALDPRRIEALGPDDHLLRAFKVGGEEGDPSCAPTLPPVLAQDPHAALLSLFAQLIHRSYEHSTELAFTKLVEVFQLQAERAEAIEKRLERAEANVRREQSERLDDMWERAEEVAAAGGSKEQIVNTLFTSFMQGQAARAAGAPSNGAPSKTNGGTQ